MYFDYISVDFPVHSVRLRKFWHGKVVMFVHIGCALVIRKEFGCLAEGWAESRKYLPRGAGVPDCALDMLGYAKRGHKCT